MPTSKSRKSARLLPQLTPVSMRRRVLDILRGAIIKGDIKPGERLTEELVCEQMAVSRAPVREALRELEQEGLIVCEPYRGCEVLDISDTEVFELLMPIRLAIEEFGFRYALQRATDADFDTLAALVERMAQAAERGDVDAAVDADVEFHETVLNLSGQVHCVQIWRTISPRTRAYFARWQRQHPKLSLDAKEHRQLLEHMRRRDEHSVLEHLRGHIFDLPSSTAVRERVRLSSKLHKPQARKPAAATAKPARRTRR